MSVVRIAYEPRWYFDDFHKRNQRWAILVAHRRAGKTVASVNDLIAKAAYNTRENPRYGYIAPLYNQAKQIAWQYLKDYTKPFNPKISESGLFVELPHNGARITLYGADNPDSFRGLYFDGIVLDEYGNMRPSTWSEVLLPTLIDRHGWAVFMGTPNGPNHFRDLYELRCKNPGWFVAIWPYQKTNVIPEDDIQEIRDQTTEEEFSQEFECSFSASTRGAFYSKEISKAELDGRINGTLRLDHNLALDFALDLGFRDDTAGWAWQEHHDGFSMQLAFADNTKPISHYINTINAVCTEYNVPRGKIWLPHDARAKTLQTGRSIVEQFVDSGIMPDIVPSLSLVDGIAAARLIFPDVYFHEDRCRDGLRALRSYHREFDEDRKIYKDSPVHDWSSHFADGFRYFGIVSRKKNRKTTEEILAGERVVKARGTHYNFTLEDLWKTQPKQRSW
jgi:phage terminase large subunit